MSNTTYEKFAGLRIYSQNVYKKYEWIDLMLTEHENLSDIILIQEPSWGLICYAPSMNDECGDPIIGMPKHPLWWCLYPKPANQFSESDRPRVAAYVHQYLWAIKPKLCSDVIKSCDIMLLTINGLRGQLYMLNVYSDSTGSAIRALSTHKSIPSPIGYLGSDFNCPSDLWDLEYSCGNSPLADVLADFAYQHGLYYRQLECPMHYPANGKNPSIIDLIFLPGNDEDSMISIGKCSESDHCPFFVELRFPILTGNKPPNIKADSEADAEFTSDIMDALNVIADHMQNSPASQSYDDITHVTMLISKCFAKAWETHATLSQTLVHLKGWWNKFCAEAWSQYRESDCSSDEWRNMWRTMKTAKCKYFNDKIVSIADHNKRPWDLMSWTRTQKPDPSEAIIFKDEPCLTTEDHWNASQETFNSAHKQDTYPTCLMQAIHFFFFFFNQQLI